MIHKNKGPIEIEKIHNGVSSTYVSLGHYDFPQDGFWYFYEYLYKYTGVTKNNWYNFLKNDKIDNAVKLFSVAQMAYAICEDKSGFEDDSIEEIMKVNSEFILNLSDKYFTSNKGHLNKDIFIDLLFGDFIDDLSIVEMEQEIDEQEQFEKYYSDGTVFKIRNKILAFYEMNDNIFILESKYNELLKDLENYSCLFK
jgi:nitrogen regulatory protein PII-like uncharacterized protein